MILKTFLALSKVYNKAAQKVASLSRSFSWAVCADKDVDHLKGCYEQAETIRVQVKAILSQNNMETCFLADLFEVCDDFPRFSDLMQYWAHIGNNCEEEQEDVYGEDERSLYRRSFKIFSLADKFERHFQQLPSVVQRMIDIGLSHHKSAIINLIEHGSNEYVRTSRECVLE